MGNSAKRTEREYERALRRAEALQWRLQGLTYEEVATKMGLSRAAVRVMCNKAIAATYKDQSEAIMEITIDRLEALLMAAIDGGKASKQPAWHDQALKVIAAQRRMLGLDRPVQSEVVQKVTISREDLEKKLDGIMQRTGEEPV